MIDLTSLKREYESLSQKLSAPDVFKDKAQYQALTRRFSFLEKIISLDQEKEALRAEQEDLARLADSPGEEEDVRKLAQSELFSIKEKIQSLEKKIEEKLFESKSAPDRDVIVEMRAAAGGGESALFVGDLFKMYSRYCEGKSWKVEILGSHPTELGGFKEIVFSVKGSGCYASFKYESGVHRVQRVPVTESGGRIHTSTVTVAVLVEPEEVELKINPEDLRIDTYRASGAGGQHVNKTDSAVRITHLPSGLVVACQDERSQIKNRAKAMRVLKAKLLDKMQQEQTAQVTELRKVQVGTGERSEKIRTYNFPERRVTDHRINLTVYKLDFILEGDLDIVVDELKVAERKKIYEAQGLVKPE